MHIEQILMNDELLEKYNETWKKVGTSIKKDLIVNLYTMKNI